MKIMHFIEMRVFSKEEDNEEHIKEKIKKLFPFEKLKIEESIVIGFEDKKIKILKVNITKNAEMNSVVKSLISKFSAEQKKLICSQIESRLDSSLNFYLRLDKEKLLKNEYEIVDHGNCFHFRFSIATYPHSRDRAIEIIKDVFKH